MENTIINCEITIHSCASDFKALIKNFICNDAHPR